MRMNTGRNQRLSCYITMGMALAVWAGSTGALYAAILPSDVANLELWLRADEGPRTSGSPSTPGDTVDQWLDQSSTSNDGAGGGTPILRSRTIGSETFPVVEFSGGGDMFTTASTSLTASGSTYFVVFSQQGQNNVNGRFISATGPSSAFRNMTTFGNSLNTYDGTNGYTFSSDLQDSVFHIGAFRAQANSPEMFLDGIAESLAATTAGGPYPAYNILVIDSLRVGADTGGGQALLGDIAEVLIYDRALTDEEFNDVGFYLQEKYEISAAFTAPVPEPSTGLLVAIGAFGLLKRRRAKRGSSPLKRKASFNRAPTGSARVSRAAWRRAPRSRRG